MLRKWVFPDICEWSKMLNCKCAKIKKIIGRTLEHSAALRITFKGTDKVYLLVTLQKSFYRVRPYVPESTQCYNCQWLGHTSNCGRGKTSCLVCGNFKVTS